MAAKCLEKSDEGGTFAGAQPEWPDSSVEIRIAASAVIVIVHHFFQSRERTIVHIRRGSSDLP
jgi:hypothetical protein